MPVLATTLVGGVLVLAAYAGPGVLGLAVIGLAVVLAYGLVGAGNLPEQVTAGALVVLTATGAVLSLSLSDVEPGAETSFAPVLRVVGPAMVAVLLAVLARPRARERAVEWLAVAASGVVLAALAAAAFALGRPDPIGPELVAIAVSAAVVGTAVAVPQTTRLGWLWSLGWLAVAVVAALLVPIGLVDETDRLVLVALVGTASGLAAAAVARAPASHVAGTRPHWSVQSALIGCVALAVAAPVAATVVRVLLA